MAIKYVPTQCRGENAIFEGSLTIKAPTFNERYTYIEESNFKYDADGEISGGMDQLPAIRKMVGASEKHYAKVEIKNKETSQAYKSFADMSIDSACDPILIEIAMNLLNGFKAGND